ncbi:MAG: aminoglycoside phosphotransferase family protein [Nanohaloarchaea archaeon]|nr:aminoglycoside phosphotransferase family protein [Candidatus Nanohaloarchaea archaeon]
MENSKSDAEKALESLGIDYKDLESLDSGSDSLFSFKSGDKSLILKMRGFEHLPESWFRKEPLFLEKASEELDMPVPETVDMNLRAENPYFVMEMLDGDSLSNRKHDLGEEDLLELCFQAGKILGELHSSTEYDRYGWIRESEGDIDRVRMSWQQVFQAMYDDRIEGLEGTEFAEYRKEVKAFVEDRIDLMNPEGPVLGHDDYRPGNIMVQESEIVGIIDWARAYATDPLYDMVKAEMNFMNELETIVDEEEVSNRFRKGYRTSREPNLGKREEVYRANTVLGMMNGFSNHWGNLMEEEKRREKADYLSEKLENLIR